MVTAVLSTKGQITIPVAVREALGLDAGDRLEFVEVAKGRFELVPGKQPPEQTINLIDGTYGDVFGGESFGPISVEFPIQQTVDASGSGIFGPFIIPRDVLSAATVRASARRR